MAKAGLVDVVATEDMDALTFGAPKLVRNMMSQTSSKDDVAAREYDYSKVCRTCSQALHYTAVNRA